MEDVKGKNVARFLNEDMSVIREIRSDEVEKAVDTLDAPRPALLLTALSIRNSSTGWSGKGWNMSQLKILKAL